MSITSSAVIVEMNISVWTAHKIDRAATDDVLISNHATREAGQFRKNLMAGTTLRKEIADYATACRNWHAYHTSPWSDRGPRLLPTSAFIAYKAELNERRLRFEGMVDKFCAFYPDWLDKQMQNSSLGNLFDPADYPSVEELRGKFGFYPTFSPLPESGDFRIDVPARELSDLRREYEREFNARLTDAMREPWQRLHTVLSAMSAKLHDVEGEEKKRYHETLVTNATSLCAVLTHLNITKDPQLEAARRELENLMHGVTIEDIKESPALRSDLKTKVDNILNGYEW